VTEFTEYPPGTPSWVDLSTTDVEGAKDFYGTLFGWEAHDAGPDAGGYHMCTLREKNVAGIGPVQHDAQPVVWGTYISVTDADATIAAVTEAGGSVMMEPFDVLDAGRMAVFSDPTGAVLCIWQPGNHKGAQLATEPGTFGWNELNTRDTAAAKAFYGSVFGWEAVDHTNGPMTYTEFKLDGRSVAGMLDMNPNVPPQVPPHWMVYFGVEDTDATVATAQEKGGKLVVGPIDIPQGRLAVLTDPQGAHFAVMRMQAR
jgi:uncharacterized protein